MPPSINMHILLPHDAPQKLLKMVCTPTSEGTFLFLLILRIMREACYHERSKYDLGFPVAQCLERPTSVRKVTGSIPVGYSHLFLFTTLATCLIFNLLLFFCEIKISTFFADVLLLFL